ncbi:helix-turn-helix transcriptional regulator [Litoribrevibacter euphylliae]|uniref:Helix-turn-helix transcriptional regulator n=1 Tax=Litoribrevibacter euphylliae TaxID=1834034 RepID=A0ABV7HFK7_9GAMM
MTLIKQHDLDIAAIPALVGRQQFISLVGISEKTFERQEAKGEIPLHFKKIGARRYWRRRDVLDFIGEV